MPLSILPAPFQRDGARNLVRYVGGSRCNAGGTTPWSQSADNQHEAVGDAATIKLEIKATDVHTARRRNASKLHPQTLRSRQDRRFSTSQRMTPW